MKGHETGLRKKIKAEEDSANVASEQPPEKTKSY